MNEENIEKELRENWYRLARDIETKDDFQHLFERLSEYPHSYGSICIAIAAVASGAAHLLNRSEKGGITGFQASIILWEFRHAWLSENSPAKIIDYSNMLYPQYKEVFFKPRLPKRTFEWMQTKAQELLDSSPTASTIVRKHWLSITKGQVPFGWKLEDDA